MRWLISPAEDGRKGMLTLDSDVKLTRECLQKPGLQQMDLEKDEVMKLPCLGEACTLVAEALPAWHHARAD